MRNHDPNLIRCAGCTRRLPKTAFAGDGMRSNGRRYKCRECSSLEYHRWKANGGFAKRLALVAQKRLELKQSNPRLCWAKSVFNGIKRRAKARQLTVTITLDWLLNNAPEHCPVFGIVLNYGNTDSYADSPAVDRIDNNLGYEPDNCWIISMKANRIKTNATVDELFAVANALRARLDKRLIDVVNVAKLRDNPPPPRVVPTNPYTA